MNPQEQGNQGQEIETQALSEDFELKMELESGLMEYGFKTLQINESKWVEYYAEIFDEMYRDSELNLKERFKSKEVYDRDPEEFYKEIHKELFERYQKRKRGI